MKRNYILILLVGALLLFSGCSTGTNAKQSGFDLGASFKGGEEGLVVSFVEGLPPEKIKDQGLLPFNVRLLVENKGENDIALNSAFVKFSGLDPASLNLDTTSKAIPAVNGFKKQGDISRDGGKQYVTFSNLKYMQSLVSGSYGLDLNINVCYPYQTKSIAEMCISGNTVSVVDDKFENCKIEGDKKFANSGAPVRIENVKQFSNGQSSIQILFDIVHTSKSTKGTIFESGSIDSNCNIGGFSPTSYDAVNLKDRVKYTVDAGLSGLDCEGSGTNSNSVLLSNNKYTVNCVLDTTGQGEGYNKLVKINLDYDYLDRISKSLTVEHVIRN